MRSGVMSALVGMALLAASCGMPSPQGAAAGSGNMITRDQMLGVNASSVYDAVQKIQPSWLTSRGPTSISNETPTVASVFMNGNQVGDVEYLRHLRLEDVDAVRFYDAGEAGARFGMGHQRGVIEVIPRGGR